jgi:hypothetical protein
MKMYIGVIIITLASILSFFIANLPTGTDPGLGGFLLLLWPPIVGFIGLLLFLIICAITKNKKVRLTASVIIALYLVYVGLGLYVDKGWPFVY